MPSPAERLFPEQPTQRLFDPFKREDNTDLTEEVKKLRASIDLMREALG